MLRLILGAALAALAMLVVGFLLHATPLNNLGTGSIGDAEAAQLQSALRATVARTGTYAVPDPDTAEQTVMYGNGPVATIHYNSEGNAARNAGRFLGGLILNFLVAMLIAFGLAGVSHRLPDFEARARLLIPLAVAASAFVHFGRPIYLHHDWSNAIYSFFGDGLALVIGGLVVAWFVKAPETRAAGPTLLTKDRN